MSITADAVQFRTRDDKHGVGSLDAAGVVVVGVVPPAAPAERCHPPDRNRSFAEVSRRHAASNSSAHLAAEPHRMNPRSMSESIRLGPTPPRGEDLPSDDGEPLETKRHRDQMNLLIDSLNEGWSDRHDFFVGGNMFLYYSETQSKKYEYRGPDVFVVLNTTDRSRKSWVVWEEEGRTPNVIIELTSESTEHIDRGPKMRIYGQLLKVPSYVIYDPYSERLDAYRFDLDHTRYEPVRADERGYVRCEPLGLFLGVVPGYHRNYREDAPWLRWIDDRGIVLPHPTEVRDREAERADAAEHENERLRAEIERLRRG